MESEENYTLAIAVNNIEILEKNLYLSPDVQRVHKHQILVKKNFPSASIAYNSAIDEAENEIIIFIHQDIYLPENWLSDLRQSLLYLKEKQINWGVLGCFGSTQAEVGIGRLCDTPWGTHGRKINNPEPVETLDEIILVIRKSSGLRFDPLLPHFHLYGTDLCMSAKNNGMTNFAFQGFCVHNTNQLLSLPKEFYDCYRYIKKKWAKYLPITTSCIKISCFDKEMYLREIRKFAGIALGRKRLPALRVDDPRTLISDEVRKTNELGK